jgi:hypothetical protein
MEKFLRIAIAEARKEAFVPEFCNSAEREHSKT